MAGLTVKLKAFDGAVTAGLAALGDDSLPEAERLPVPVNANLDVHQLAVYAAANAVSNPLVGANRDCRALVANAAYLVVGYGLVAKGLDAGGGDIRDVPQSFTSQAMINDAESLLNEENLKKAATIIMASKVNWWETNHHTGPGCFSPYMAKVVSTTYPKADRARLKKWVHAAGRWASTHQALKSFKITCARNTSSRWQISPRHVITMADDITIRNESLPAGTEKHAICHAAFKKYHAHVGFIIASNKRILFACVEEVQKLLKDTAEHRVAVEGGKFDVADPRTYYHKGATFLNNKPRKKFASAEATGIVGSILYHHFKRASMTKSAHIFFRSTKVYEQSDSFDVDFDMKMAALSKQASVLNPRIYKVLSAPSRPAVVDPIYSAMVQSLGGDADFVKGKIASIQTSLSSGRLERANVSSERKEREEDSSDEGSEAIPRRGKRSAI